QDFDPQRSNYGVVEDHPELIDINFPKEKLPEWQHSNTVTYNPELDQVMITDRNFDELWVIDHSTTTAEAKGHTGGDQGRGGDLLYRWGNPRAYRAGNLTDQVLYGPHDAQWIAP
ncbi:MAG: arylsulfotransferase, partial [Thermoplasmata archaeon]|nr:arylsulfotransferase [Thermoplasmata archaeon]NIS14524.1 arylsulfotransferase [Thermoplasmata archaeon]NIS22359.1 arylsulfotransferase [Thermoplasmata archaeon]NIT80260.1 arylsulfotransferase [Thermoplasmata archaeon]NIU51369.1 arylsulfotransferase [Thermoplasmata archaeon]